MDLTQNRENTTKRRTREIAALALLAIDVTAVAQKTTGGIEGVITDASGAVVPNARVTATDEVTRERLQTTSDGTGAYRFLDVHPDTYVVTVQVTGFKGETAPHVLVQIARTSSLNLTLSAAIWQPLQGAAQSMNFLFLRGNNVRRAL